MRALASGWAKGYLRRFVSLSLSDWRLWRQMSGLRVRSSAGLVALLLAGVACSGSGNDGGGGNGGSGAAGTGGPGGTDGAAGVADPAGRRGWQARPARLGRPGRLERPAQQAPPVRLGPPGRQERPAQQAQSVRLERRGAAGRRRNHRRGRHGREGRNHRCSGDDWRCGHHRRGGGGRRSRRALAGPAPRRSPSPPGPSPTQHFAEGADVGDINGDGMIDLVAGPHWYAGPGFTLGGTIIANPPSFTMDQYSTSF